MAKKQNHILIMIGITIILFGNYIAQDSSIKCSVCFTPGQNCTQIIVNEIKNAKKSIFIQSYSFTSTAIANALIDAAQRGIYVVCIFDNSQKNKPLIDQMAQYIEIYIDKPAGIAHNKVIIIDENIVLTGSFNFTLAAQNRNVENSIKITSKTIAKQYKEQWQNRKKIAKNYQEVKDITQ